MLKLVSPKDIAFVLADREFIGATWFSYLEKRRVPFAIRIRKNSLCDDWCPVYALFAHLPSGDLKALTNSYAVYGCRLRIVGMRRRNDYALIATNRSPAKAFLAYQRRWEIEMLFSALKKRGFDIESTQLHFTSLTTS